jgi:hypothetical protein
MKDINERIRSVDYSKYTKLYETGAIKIDNSRLSDKPLGAALREANGDTFLGDLKCRDEIIRMMKEAAGYGDE